MNAPQRYATPTPSAVSATRSQRCAPPSGSSSAWSMSAGLRPRRCWRCARQRTPTAGSGGHPYFHPHAGSQKESPYGLRRISIAIPPAWRRLLLGDACLSELPCQEWPVSPRRCDWGVNRHQKWRTRVPGDPSRAARLIPRIPGAVRLWPKWARASWDTLLGLHNTGGTNE